MRGKREKVLGYVLLSERGLCQTHCLFPMWKVDPTEFVSSRKHSLFTSFHYNYQLLDMVSFHTASDRTLTNATPEAAMTAFVK